MNIQILLVAILLQISVFESRSSFDVTLHDNGKTINVFDAEEETHYGPTKDEIETQEDFEEIMNGGVDGQADQDCLEFCAEQLENENIDIFPDEQNSVCDCENFDLEEIALNSVESPISDELLTCQTFFCQAMLERHNFYRGIHRVGNLSIDPSLSRSAQEYALTIVRLKRFAHDKSLNGLGENLASQWRSNRNIKLNSAFCASMGTSMTDQWYDEIEDYNFDKPGFSSKVGHFTQVVWKATTTIGCGFANDVTSGSFYGVARYFPSGNVLNPGQFKLNVLPPR